MLQYSGHAGCPVRPRVSAGPRARATANPGARFQLMPQQRLWPTPPEPSVEAGSMRVMQYARLSLSAAVVAFALSACGKDSSGPSEFNAQGTTSDMAAAHDAFASEPSASFVSVGAEISAALGGSPVAITAPSVSPRPTAATLAYARQ